MPPVCYVLSKNFRRIKLPLCIWQQFRKFSLYPLIRCKIQTWIQVVHLILRVSYLYTALIRRVPGWGGVEVIYVCKTSGRLHRKVWYGSLQSADSIICLDLSEIATVTNPLQLLFKHITKPLISESSLPRICSVRYWGEPFWGFVNKIPMKQMDSLLRNRFT